MRRLKVVSLGFVVLFEVVAFSATVFGQSFMRGPEGGACPTPIVCPPTPNPDYTCVNPAVKQHVNANISLCLECSDALLAKADSCRSGCTITSCPPGQYLDKPDSPQCECKDICSQFGDISRIGVQRVHALSALAPDAIAGFMNGGTQLNNAAELNAASPCMERVRERCSAMFTTQYCSDPASCLREGSVGHGMTSYRNPASKYGFLDTCISSALQVALGTNKLTYAGQSGSNDVFSTSGYVYADCSPVEPEKVALITQAGGCGKVETTFREYTSPISLIWAPDVKIKDVVSRSKFPLNPAEAGRWFVWRASGLTPLVVWDPEHTGEITKANQLFGNYTWDKTWKNGYEPLATLDIDRSHWLEGAELAKLALWFDFNQDGISDKGEVKRLSDVGITALGVNSSYEEPSTHNIFADQGFKRVVNGHEIQGLSVDWFAGSTDERLGLEALYPELPVVPAALAPTDAAASTKATSGISGLWDWQAVDPSGEELPENLPQGSFIIYETEDGLKGSAFINQRLAPNRSGISEKVIRAVLKGELVKRTDKKVQVTFSTKNLNGEKVESIAQLSDDKRVLKGVTTEDQGPGQEKIKYGWVARRQNF